MSAFIKLISTMPNSLADCLAISKKSFSRSNSYDFWQVNFFLKNKLPPPPQQASIMDDFFRSSIESRKEKKDLADSYGVLIWRDKYEMNVALSGLENFCFKSISFVISSLYFCWLR